MKPISILISLLFSMNVFAAQAPKVVLDAFSQKFTGATNVKWEGDNEKGYEATFDYAGKRTSAVYNAHGQWLATHIEVGTDGLPAIVKVVLQTRFIGWDISTAHKIEKADGTNLFQASMIKDKLLKEVLIKPDGVILK